MSRNQHGILSLSMLFLLLLLATASSAETPPRQLSPEDAEKELQDWRGQLAEINRLLIENKSQKAYGSASALLREMTNRLTSGASVGRFLGLATVLRAVAAYQLGREDEALWHWHVSTQLFPDLEISELSSYDEAGEFLKSHPLSDEKPVDLSMGAEGQAASAEKSAPAGDVQRPRKKTGRVPVPPFAKRGGQPVSVIVRVIIGKDGRIRAPTIIESRGELTLVCATLDALRKWEFEPALRDGEPVEVYYNLISRFNTQP